MDQNPKQQIVEKLLSASNVLVTVSKNPTVDQLAAAIGFQLMLNEINIRATAIFSGEVPNALEFLDPEKNFDNSVDGLRDFIISIDKDKADKLRYKVEDNVVRIFITPFKDAIGEEDLVFSQGDINVDVVVALGVADRNDLDEAIMAHGRILHDATIASITAGADGQGDMGAINWHDPASSSICEMLVSMSEALKSGVLDKAMSTAFLTGIVSATERFSNDKTTPRVMTMAAQLMAAGADQQLISRNLRMDRGRTKELEAQAEATISSDGTIVDLHQGEPNTNEVEEIDSSEGEPDLSVPEMPSGLPPLPLAPAQEPAVEPIRPPIAKPDDYAAAELKNYQAARDSGLPPLPINQPAPEPVTMDSDRHYVENQPASASSMMTEPQESSFSAQVPSVDGQHNISSTEAAKSEETVTDLEMSQRDPSIDIAKARQEVDAALNSEPFTPDNQPTASLNAAPMEDDEEKEIHIDEQGKMVYVEEPQVLPPPPMPQPMPVPQPQLQSPAPPPNLPPPLPPNPSGESSFNPLFPQP